MIPLINSKELLPFRLFWLDQQQDLHSDEVDPDVQYLIDPNCPTVIFNDVGYSPVFKRSAHWLGGAGRQVAKAPASAKSKNKKNLWLSPAVKGL